MSRWGRGFEVGIRKEIWRQRKATERAAALIELECGTRHETGSRAELCPKCQKFASDREREK